MRRGDRLFQLLLELGRGRVRTARQLGERLGVSERTVYRDIADLAAQGTPIEGAAGIGYSLRAGYQVPPLMFDREELAALALGAAWVSGYADEDLRAAADRVLNKIDAVLPQRLRPGLKAEGIEVLAFSHDPATRQALTAARRALADRPNSARATWIQRMRRPVASSGRSDCSTGVVYGRSPPGASCAWITAVSGSIASSHWKACRIPFPQTQASISKPIWRTRARTKADLPACGSSV